MSKVSITKTDLATWLELVAAWREVNDAWPSYRLNQDSETRDQLISALDELASTARGWADDLDCDD